MYKETNIEIFNFGVGNSIESKIFYELPDSNSSTFNLIDQSSSYFKRKNKILSFFFKKKFNIKKNYVSQIKLSGFIKKKKIIKIDILKIDTEGYELEVIKGLEENIKIVNFIYFEHHYDNMIKKNYKFSEIHYFLLCNNFYRVFKIKMPLIKSFDYIYKKNKV
jgi:FkbM family methyltransferase